MVWENVPGAFSSNKGEDFRIVLEEIAKVADKDAVIPRPTDGKWRTSGCIVGDGWSVAWRVFDAQFWGVPQRRRRIALVADFGGQSAPEILFVRQSVSRDTESSKPKRKATSTDVERSIGADDREGEVPYTLKIRSGCEGGNNQQWICQGLDAYNQSLTGGKAKTLTSSKSDAEHIPCVIHPVYSVENHPNDSRVGINEDGKVQALTSRMGTGGGNVTMVMQCYSKSKRAQSATDNDTDNGDGPSAAAYCIGNGQAHDALKPDKELCKTLNCMADPMKVMVAYGFDPSASRDVGQYFLEEKANVLTNGTCPGHHNATVIKQTTRYIVRRLTPLECERLQGYPDGWTDIGEWTDSNGKKRQTSDAARYKALGNSISLPNWRWVLKRLCACYERDATMASLFDGIGGFPYLWEQLNGKETCLWASEIEEFPIAVTKARIG
jgi:DNA (cytosine-5)-methyltransferase 1